MTLDLMLHAPDNHSAYVYSYWGFFSRNLPGDSEIVILQYKVRGIIVRLAV